MSAEKNPDKYIPPAARRKQQKHKDKKKIPEARDNFKKNQNNLKGSLEVKETISGQSKDINRAADGNSNLTSPGASDDDLVLVFEELSLGKSVNALEKEKKQTKAYRPETNALVANRMIAHALGIPIIRSPGREIRDKLALEKAKERGNGKQ